MCFQMEYDTFGTEESYFRQLRTQLQAKRLRLAECLRSVGLQPFVPDGGYFIITDISNLSESLHTYMHIHGGGVKYFASRIISYARQYRGSV